MQVGGKLKLRPGPPQAWMIGCKDLRARQAAAPVLLAGAAQVVIPERDAKLAELKALIERKVAQPDTQPARQGQP
ncbi:MAG: hypothetical protein MZV65_36240 [Chromatiales bacterium]|nr:hypothetical protein [Chromatiales bacterium]